MNWECDYCDADNSDYGSCVTEGCPGRFDKEIPVKKKKENNMNAGLHPIKETTKQFRTKYDVIFELVRLGAVLTGSRAFGTEHADSDWDFVISEKNVRPTDEDVWSEFKVEGLSVVSYKDTNTLKVLKAHTYPIHVQVSKNIKQKIAAQELLLTLPKFVWGVNDNTTKTRDRKLWDWALEQVEDKN